MRVYLVRHGLAENREHFAQKNPDDSLRPLKARGRREFRQTAKWLAKSEIKLDWVFSSPWKRALQTAEILSEECSSLNRLSTNAIALPTTPPAHVARWLQEQEHSSLAVVGHEPHLSRLALYLICGTKTLPTKPRLEFKKGAIMALDFKHKIAAGQARLAWLISPELVVFKSQRQKRNFCRNQ